MHLGGLFISKSAKTSKKDCKSTKTKSSKFVPQSFRIWLKALHGELVDKKKSSYHNEARTHFSSSRPYMFDDS